MNFGLSLTLYFVSVGLTLALIYWQLQAIKKSAREKMSELVEEILSSGKEAFRHRILGATRSVLERAKRRKSD
ncbi:MAG: hypothetical protein AAF483_04675 [Planctomycetota bacterium]